MTPTAAFVRSVLYGLKRQFGQSIDIYQLDSTTFNPATGQQVVNKSRYRLRRAIVLDADQLRKFSYDLTYIAANKNFTIGGHYDVNERGFIIDCGDLPKTFSFKQKDLIVCDDEKYETKEIKDFNKGAWLVIGKRLVGAAVDKSQNLGVSTSLNITQSQDGEIE